MNRPKKMPKIGLVMTSFPYCVDVSDTVAKIERMMDDHDIRHLPVQEKGKVVGIISERDLHHVVNRTATLEEKANIRARDVMVGDPFLVAFQTPLKQVASAMAERHIGSAIVIRRGKLAGIFTVVDACRVLSEYLDALFPSSGGDAAA